MVIPSKEAVSMNKPVVSFETLSKGMYDVLPLLTLMLLHVFAVPSKAFYGYNTLRRGENNAHTRDSSL